jgi:Holliday junction resolvase RusA-like endonuclease
MYKALLVMKMATHNELKRWWSNPRPHVGRALYRKYQAEITARFPAVVDRVKGRKKVSIIYYTRRMQDADNFLASLKPLLDVMVTLGIIEDDSPSHIDLDAYQDVTSGRAYLVEIKVTD